MKIAARDVAGLLKAPGSRFFGLSALWSGSGVGAGTRTSFGSTFL